MPPLKAQGHRSLFMQWSGTEAMRKHLSDLGTAGPVILAVAVREEAEELIEDSKENYVPVLDGGLRGSGYVKPVEVIPTGSGAVAVVKFGFGGPSAPYAFVTHENPRAGKTGGVSPQGQKYKRWATVGGWKFLELPMFKRLPTMGTRIGKRIAVVWAAKVKK